MYRNRQAIMEILFNEGPMAIAVVEQPGVFRLVNDRFAKMLGYTIDELQHKTFQEITHPDDIDKDLELYTKLNAGEIDSYNMEKRYLCKDHSTIWINLHVSLASQDKKFALAMVYDVSALKDEQIKAQDAASQYQTAIDKGAVGLWVWDTETGLLFWNDVMLNLYGKTQQEFTGNVELDFFRHLHKEDEEHVRNHLEEVLQGKCEYNTEFRIIQQNTKKERYILARGGRFFSESEQKWLILGTNTDITSLKQAQQSLLEANKNLEHFAFTTSHDMKEPIRAIRGFTELLDEALPPSEQHERASEFMSLINKNIDKMELLIGDLLTFARTGNAKMTLDDVHICDIVQDIEDTLKVSYPDVNINIECECDHTVYCSPNSIMQLMLNLLSNSVKYRQSNIANIKISYKENKDHYKFSVTDDGIGIPDKDLPHVFKLFYRVKSNDEATGTGLGLAICEKIVNRHGGKIWIESKLNKGTTVHFTISKMVKSDIINQTGV